MNSNENPYRILFEQLQPRVDRRKLESPLERTFIEKLEKYLNPSASVMPQYEVETIAGRFRLDFLIIVNDKKIGFECDGAEFHNDWRDEWRDAMILGSSKVDTIYRFRGKDIHTFLDDCVYLIYHYDRDIFYERCALIANSLSSETVRSQLSNKPFAFIERNDIYYTTRNTEDRVVGSLQLLVERRCVQHPGHWKILYEVALKNPGLNLDQLMEVRNKEVDYYFNNPLG